MGKTGWSEWWNIKATIQGRQLREADHVGEAAEQNMTYRSMRRRRSWKTILRRGVMVEDEKENVDSYIQTVEE